MKSVLTCSHKFLEAKGEARRRLFPPCHASILPLDHPHRRFRQEFLCCQVLTSLVFWSKSGMLLLATFSVQFPLIWGCWLGAGISWQGHRILSAESLILSWCTQGLWGRGPQAGSGMWRGRNFSKPSPSQKQLNSL